jgi:hypothetical protein
MRIGGLKRGTSSLVNKGRKQKKNSEYRSQKIEGERL